MQKKDRRLLHSLLDQMGGKGDGRQDSRSLSSFLKVGKRPRSLVLMGSPEGPILLGLKH
jgi:hypothetical protein